MANVFANLAVPAADGVGASQSVATMGRIKTITVGGQLVGPTLTVEISLDNTNWLPLKSWTKPGKYTFNLAAGWMRVRIGGYLAGVGMTLAANVDVASNDHGTQILALTVPVADGVGAAVDVSALGTFNTIAFAGTITAGTFHVEISEDNTDWLALEGLNAPGHFSMEFVARYMRVRRSGNSGGTCVVHVAAVNDPASSGGSTDVGLYAPPEKWTQQDIAAGQTDVDLSALMSISFDTIKAIRAGSIVGLSTRLTEAVTDATASSMVVTVTINGVAGTLALSHTSALNPTGGEATQLAGIDTFVAGDLIGVQLTTLGSFTPITTDLEAWLEVQAS
jgi:hypothetical protein